jgi:ABC-type antimicrobial peptide transport system permease subunit
VQSYTKAFVQVSARSSGKVFQVIGGITKGSVAAVVSTVVATVVASVVAIVVAIVVVPVVFSSAEVGVR